MTDQYTESQTSFFPASMKQGLIFGMIMVIITLVASITGLASELWFSAVIMPISIVLYIVAAVTAIKNHRNEDLGGYITFGRAFLTGLMTILIVGLIATIFSIINLKFINPGIAEQQLDATREFLEKLGTEDDIIDQAMAEAERKMKNIGSLLLNGMIAAAIGGAIISLICAAVLKRNREDYA